MSGVSTTSEIAAVASAFGWTWDDVRTVTERAVAGAFLPDDEKARLLDQVVRPGYAALVG
jgi:adenosine deaminase